MNPHLHLVGLDPPRKHPKRRWRCENCGQTGFIEELETSECPVIPEPCEYCGQTPECAPDCPGVREALSQPGVYVAGGTERT